MSQTSDESEFDVLECILLALGKINQQTLQTQSMGYRSLLFNAERTDFNQPDERQAYLFKYVVSFVSAVSKIADLVDLATVLNKPRQDLRVGCLGGGPGSDQLGLIKYYLSLPVDQRPSKLSFTNWDKCDMWGDLWTEVFHNVQGGIGASYIHLDIANPQSIDRICQMSTVSRIDLLTMIKFASSVYAIREDNNELVNRTLVALLKAMKTGSLLFVVDNGREKTHLPDSFVQWIEDLAQKCEFRLLRTSHNKAASRDFVSVDADITAIDIERLCSAASLENDKPLLHGMYSYRLLRKN